MPNTVWKHIHANIIFYWGRHIGGGLTDTQQSELITLGESSCNLPGGVPASCDLCSSNEHARPHWFTSWQIWYQNSHHEVHKLFTFCNLKIMLINILKMSTISKLKVAWFLFIIVSFKMFYLHFRLDSAVVEQSEKLGIIFLGYCVLPPHIPLFPSCLVLIPFLHECLAPLAFPPWPLSPYSLSGVSVQQLW